MEKDVIRNNLDHMFTALYGEKQDEYGCKFSNYYNAECNNICDDIDTRITTLHDYGVELDDKIISSLLIISEQEHIGNDLHIDQPELNKLSSDIIHGYTK